VRVAAAAVAFFLVMALSFEATMEQPAKGRLDLG
jgi:hypothetical protein